jgi:hypothetical protein
VTWTSRWLHDKGLCWEERLRQSALEARTAQERAEPKPDRADPWEARLADLKGEVNDAHERVPSFVVFDHLGLGRSERHSGAARRVVRAMRHLGWQRARFQVRSGCFQRVPGFQRHVESDKLNAAERPNRSPPEGVPL